jgi:hypothetical protein
MGHSHLDSSWYCNYLFDILPMAHLNFTKDFFPIASFISLMDRLEIRATGQDDDSGKKDESGEASDPGKLLTKLN